MDANFRFFKQGAESKIYFGEFGNRQCVIKERFSKKYRHSVLDDAICKERTKTEAKSLLRCHIAGIRVPAVYFVDIHKCRLWLEVIENSITVKEFVIGLSDNKLDLLAVKIGAILALMHTNDIIHGDLTTSNMLISPPFETLENISLIDFGLSRVDISPEEKGVDLYVLKRAFISTHPTKSRFLDSLFDSYQVNYKKSEDVMKKLAEIELRGRKRTMVG